MGAQEIKQNNYQLSDDIFYAACVFKNDKLIGYIMDGSLMSPTTMGAFSSREVAATKRELNSTEAKKHIANGCILGICKREIKNTLII